MLARPYRSITLALVSLISLIAFEALAIATAMPVAAEALGGIREYALAFSLFMTTALVGTVAAGGWSDRSGPRAPTLVGLVVFAAGLIVSGAAMDFTIMVVGRAVSGLGAGLQSVVVYLLIARLYPKALQPRMFSVVSAAWVLPSLIGPPIAGLLASEISWRAVFLIVPPVLIAPAITLWPHLRRAREPAEPAEPTQGEQGSPFARLARGTALAASVTVLQWGLLGAGALPGVAVAAAGAIAALACLPGLLPAGTLLLRRGLPALVVARGLFSATFFGAETFVPLMLVTGRGLSPGLAGAALTVGAVGWSAGAWLQGRTSGAAARLRLLAGGGLALGLSVLALALTPLDGVPPVLVAPIWILAGVGMGMAMSSSSVLLIRLSEPTEQGRNASALQIGDTLGGVLGIGLAGAVFAALHDPAGDDSGVFAMIWVGLGVLGLISAAVALRTRETLQR